MWSAHGTTKTERFTLSKGSGNLVHNMKQTLTVDAYVTRGLPKLDTFVRDLRDLLQDYKDSSGGKFQYQIIDAKDEETRKKATSSIMPAARSKFGAARAWRIASSN